MAAIRQIYPEDHEKWLADRTTLWRYVPLKTLLCYLCGNIFIPSVAKLREGDPFEGHFALPEEWFFTAMQDHYKERFGPIQDFVFNKLFDESDKEGVKIDPSRMPEYLQAKYLDFVYKTRFAWCWFESPSESALMWASYGREGAAVSMTVGKLREALGKTKWQFEFGQMRYTLICGENAVELDPEAEYVNLLLRPHFLKREEYEGEKEVRFVTCGPSENSPGTTLPGVPPSECIQTIHLWPGLQDSVKRSLKEIAQKLAPSVSCVPSVIFGETWQSSDLSDLVHKTIEFLWNKCDDGVPPELKRL